MEFLGLAVFIWVIFQIVNWASMPDIEQIVSSDFWEFLQEKALENDAWWLDGWLDDCLKEYQNKLKTNESE